jgi:hypothetical protein
VRGYLHQTPAASRIAKFGVTEFTGYASGFHHLAAAGPQNAGLTDGGGGTVLGNAAFQLGGEIQQNLCIRLRAEAHVYRPMPLRGKDQT